MTETSPLTRRSPLDKLGIALGAVLIALGLITWAGWALREGGLLQPIRGMPAMKPNEAACWILAGLSLLGLECKQRSMGWLSIPALAIAGLTLFEHLTHLDLHLDELVIRDSLLTETEYPGRMSFITATALLLGSGVLLWRTLLRAREACVVAEALTGSILSSVGFSTLLGYLVSLPAVYRWGSNTATNPAGSFALLALGIALLFHAWRSSFRSEHTPPAWAPMPPVIICFTMTVILWIGMRERELLYLGSTTQTSINTLATAIEAERTQSAAIIQEHISIGGTRVPVSRQEDWASEVASLYEIKKDAGCVLVSWVDTRYTTVWVYPNKGYEALRGFLHSSEEARASALRYAITRHTASFSSSVTLPVSGEKGFVIYVPVYRNDELVGFFAAEYAYKPFFSVIDRKIKLSEQFDTLISVNGVPVYGTLNPEDLLTNPQSVEISAVMQENRIRMAVSPNERSLQHSRRYLPELTLLSGLGITALLGLAVHFARSARTGMIASEQYNQRLVIENEERRRVEEKLKTSDERLRLALDSTGIGIFEWNLANGYVYYSSGLWLMLGYEPSRMSATVDAFQSLIHQDDLPAFRRRLESQISGTAHYIEPEFRIRSRSGDWRWLYLRARTIMGGHGGHSRRIVGTVQDVTARREAEEALRASQAATRKLSLVASRTDNPVVILSPDGRVEWVNDSFVRSMEYPLSEIVGLRAPDFLSGQETDSRSIGRLRSSISAGKSASTDLVQYSKSGKKFHMIYDLQPVRNRSAEIENFIMVASDITSRVETELALRKAKAEADAASRAKSEFLASMSHEIRTPMNGVIGMTSLLLETPLSQDQREYVNTIRNSGEALLAIINDILDFSKIESGKMELEHQPFDLTHCIEESIEMFSIQALTKQIDLVFHIERDVPSCIVGDLTRLRQVLVNLINNAVKFTPKGSISIEVRISPEDPVTLGVVPGRQLLEFRIQDTGIGIPQDRLSRLFKVFSQVDSSTTRKFGGTGLGLAICERLCSLMGGGIRVESVEGVGSCFIFTIQAEGAPALYVEPIPPLPAPLAKAAMIAITAHPVSQRRIHALLSSWGAPVSIVGDPDEVPGIFSSALLTPPLILVDLDINNPAEFLSKIRDLRAPRLVMLPFGYAPPDLPKDGNDYFYITKPLRGHSLYLTITNIFKQLTIESENEAAKVRERLLGEEIPLRVLLVEDNPVNQKVALRFLDRLGYKAGLACNGLEAVAAVENGEYDLVIMDLQMPEMDGLEASRQIRARIHQERQPTIIALTANALHGDRDSCLDAGMDDYITKPIRVQELAEIIRRHFGSSVQPASKEAS